MHLPLDSLTVLIGENNTGKSTVLEAIRLVLMPGFGVRRGGQFTEYDFHLKDADVTPQTADPISITLHFAEEQEDEWPNTVIQQMNEEVQLDENGLYHIRLQAKGAFQAESASFETKWAFLNSDGAELNLKNATPLNLISRFVPLFFLSALRDASQEFGQRGQFWSGFLKSIQLPDNQRERIEEMLREINTSVIGANAGLTEVTKKIADAGRLVPLDSADPVTLEAIPTRVFDMVGKIQVYLKSSYGAKLPLHRHGEGTQSLAVLMLFQSFAVANLSLRPRIYPYSGVGRTRSAPSPLSDPLPWIVSGRDDRADSRDEPFRGFSLAGSCHCVAPTVQTQWGNENRPGGEWSLHR